MKKMLTLFWFLGVVGFWSAFAYRGEGFDEYQSIANEIDFSTGLNLSLN
jgi:hypothetical protein